MAFKCSGCWQEECICGRYGSAPVQDTFFVVLDLPYVPDTSMRPISFLKTERDRRYLENLQRMKNIEDMDKKMEEKNWHETEEGKQQLLEIVNEKFSFGKDGTIYCRECKNESVACVCMNDEDA